MVLSLGVARFEDLVLSQISARFLNMFQPLRVARSSGFGSVRLHDSLALRVPVTFLGSLDGHGSVPSGGSLSINGSVWILGSLPGSGSV